MILEPAQTSIRIMGMHWSNSNALSSCRMPWNWLRKGLSYLFFDENRCWDEVTRERNFRGSGGISSTLTEASVGHKPLRHHVVTPHRARALELRAPTVLNLHFTIFVLCATSWQEQRWQVRCKSAFFANYRVDEEGGPCTLIDFGMHSYNSFFDLTILP